jgi:hypothetical protein
MAWFLAIFSAAAAFFAYFFLLEKKSKSPPGLRVYEIILFGTVLLLNIKFKLKTSYF